MSSRVARKAEMLPTVLIVLVAALLVGGCAKNTPLTTKTGQSYEIVSVDTENSYAGRTAKDGNELLLVSVRGAHDQLDDMEEVFYGDSKAKVSNGSSTATCQLIVYSPTESGNIDAILVFEVPSTFGEEFAMRGEGFEDVELTLGR